VNWTGGSVAWNGSYAANYDKTLSVAEMPTHNHDVTTTIRFNSSRSKGNGANFNGNRSQGDSQPTGTNYGSTYDPDTGNTTSNAYVIVGATGGGESFPMNTTFSLSGNDLSPTISNRAGALNAAINSGGAHQTVANNTLTADGSGTATVTDNTVQPYITCYMYKRTALAPFNS